MVNKPTFLLRRPELRRHKYITEMELEKKALASVAPLLDSDIARRINNSVKRGSASSPTGSPVRTLPASVREESASPLQSMYNEEENRMMEQLSPRLPREGGGCSSLAFRRC